MSHMSLRDGLSRQRYLVLGAVKVVPLSNFCLRSVADDSYVSSVVSCSSTSPPSATPPASHVLTSGSEGLLN